MAQGLLLASQFAAGGGFLVLAAGLLVVRFNSRVNRAFAVYLLLHGGAILTLAAARATADARTSAALLSFLPHLVLPLPFVLLYFLAVYKSPTGGRWPRAAGLGALAATVFVNGAYVVNPCLAYCTTAGVTTAGPLAPIYAAAPLMQAAVALSLARGSMKPALRAPAMRLVSTAFAMMAFLEGSLVLMLFMSEGTGGLTAGFATGAWIVLQRIVGLAAFAVGGAAFLLLGRTPGQAWRIGVVAAVAFGTALMVGASGLADPGRITTSVSQLLIGTWRLAAVGLVTYALVRHRFLALDKTLSFAVQKGTVVTMLVATFLIVFQVVENILDERLGWIFGGLVTGTMLLAFRPIERLGQRVAHVVVPRGGDASVAATDERIRLFQEQAHMVWSDGIMGRKERMLLDNLRDRLQLPFEVAARLEHEAAIHAPATAANPPILSTSS